MRSFVMFSLAAVSLAISGCAQHVCDHQEKTIAELKKKASGCNAVFEISGWPACTAVLSNGGCSAAELGMIDKHFDCMDKVGQCVAGQEKQWYDTVTACSSNIDNVSAACRQALLKQ